MRTINGMGALIPACPKGWLNQLSKPMRLILTGLGSVSNRLNRRVDENMGWRNPLEPSEFEVQVIAYNTLKQIFKNVRGEFHYRKDGKRAARFDIAILDSDNLPKIIIEVKTFSHNKMGAQVERYQKLTGLPVIGVKGEDQANKIASRIIASYSLESWFKPLLIDRA